MMSPEDTAKSLAAMPIGEARSEWSRIVDESKQFAKEPETGRYQAALAFNALLATELRELEVDIWSTRKGAWENDDRPASQDPGD